MADYYQWERWSWDEERDLAGYKGWACNSKDTVRTRSLLDVWMWLDVYCDYCGYAAEWLQVPTSKGPDWRLKDGWGYAAINVVPEEERPKREVEFRKRIAPWIEDFEHEYRKETDELEKQAEKFKVLYPDRKELNAGEIKRAFEDWIHFYRITAHYHFRWMYIFCMISKMFNDLCSELTGIDRYHPLFNDVMGGFTHKVLQTDAEMWRISKMAVEMGLAPIFESTRDNREVLRKISQQGENGKTWLDELNKVTQIYGWRTSRNWDVSSPSWIEDPSLTFEPIRVFLKEPLFAPDKVRHEQVMARQKAEKELISRIPETRRDLFGKLLKGAQWANIVQEEHPFYTEQIGNSIGRFITKEIGERWSREGAVDDPGDIYYLLPDEIYIRIVPGSKFSPKKIVKIRRQQHEEFRKAEPQMFLGDQNAFYEVMKYDPLIMSVVSPAPRERPELKADLYGTIAAPGVAEGAARVALTTEEAEEFKSGEILVTVETNVQWNPLFSIAAGVVTDGGGVLSHASIVGRQYGIPVVSGTLEGTRKIKTGMRIRIDGNLGTVYILDKGTAQKR
jgi:pyruvate,water dikinase